MSIQQEGVACACNRRVSTMMRIDVSVPEKQGLIVRSKEGFMAEQEAGCLSFVRALHTKQVDHNATPNRSITISTLARRRASSAHTAPLRRKEHKAHTARTAHTERAAHTTPLGQTQHTNSTLAQPSTINTLHNRAQHSHTSEQSHASKHKEQAQHTNTTDHTQHTHIWHHFLGPQGVYKWAAGAHLAQEMEVMGALGVEYLSFTIVSLNMGVSSLWCLSAYGQPSMLWCNSTCVKSFPRVG